MIKKIVFILILILFPFSVKATTELPVDVLNMTIEEIQEARSLNLFTYEDLVKFYLERIEKYKKQYNCIISINDKAIERAKELDKKYNESGLISNLMGIPIIVKDNIDVYGMPTTAGTKALKDNYPNKNSSVVQKLIDSGAIILAKSNMSELAFSASNSKSSYGHVYNAYNTLYSPYGSSGGTAVAIASGLAVAGLGTDTNASIRTPASANNVVGMRPTYGLLNDDGIIKYDATRDTVGPITRYVSDNAIILSILSGKNYTNKDFDKYNIKIGVISSWMKEKSSSNVTSLSSTYKEIVSLTNKSIDVFKKNNIEIVEIEDFYSNSYESLIQSTYSGRMTLCYEFNKYISNTSSKIRNFEQLISNGGYLVYLNDYNNNCYTKYSTTSSYKNNISKRNEFKEYVDNIMKKYDVDVLLYPTTKNKLLKITETEVVDLKTNSYVIAPVIGYPAINLPIGFDSDSLPYGMELLTTANNEELLYSLGILYEENTNYYKLPNISPNLYELPKNINTLIDYYKKYKSSEYKEINEKTKDFFKNYNEIDDKETIINEYVSEYESIKKEHKRNNPLVIFIILLFIFMTLIKIFIDKIKRKKKRRK